ncbi:IQ motif and ubiquitin-like domain-containing protein [Oscarella lobularis]|uniref:IQ motif and ubiquitin-like domain-containing protein n=1 Tax=Oscarella lobularis TaxID=121494 RepID=UPI00331364EA
MESVTEAIREDGENSEKAEEIVTSAAMDVRVDVREDDNKTERSLGENSMISSDYAMPKYLTVTIDSEEGQVDAVTVAVERSKAKKPYLGGYRHKVSGVEYHHAGTMTIPKRKPDDGVIRYQRETQTFFTKQKSQQTHNNTSTQMSQTGCSVSNEDDKILIARRYETADEFHAKRLKAVIVLQSYYRRWNAMILVNGMKIDKKRRLDWERKEAIRKEKEKEERLRVEFERRMNPKTKEDFDMLYHALEMWRKDELAKIDESLKGPERKAALCSLLEQEAELIASIGRHQIVADDDRRRQNIRKILEKAASPRKWIAFDGKLTEMDTPYTIRSKELRALYDSLNMKFLTQEERMDVLLSLKATVVEHDCKLTREIVELVERETDLILRETKQKNLEGLRKRISNLFLQYIKTPQFNPEIARLTRVPHDSSKLLNDVYYCRTTGKYLPSTEFELSSNAKSMKTSRKAAQLSNISGRRQDNSLYREMLRQIRRSEEKYDDDSRLIFIIQEVDLRHLVETIWNGQSILSNHEDLHDLVIVRWDVAKQWSPWNCILLTQDEASGHFRLENLFEAYSSLFVEKVKYRHVIARNYFRRLVQFSEQATTVKEESGQ